MAIGKYKEIREAWIKIEYKLSINKTKDSISLTLIYTSNEHGLVEAY